MTSATTAANHSAATTPAAKPAIIATRQHCEAEGVGLSHYILMDRAAPATTPADVPAATA